MWPITNFTICFRGLLVIHKVDTVQPNFFEIGVVNDPHHFLKINTIKNGVLAESTSLEKHVNTQNKIWTLEVENPIGTGVTTYTRGPVGPINRTQHPFERDFRWIVELNDLNNVLPGVEIGLKTNEFAPVLRIHNGIFSTRVKSPELSMLVDGASQDFGFLAAVVACDIPMLPGQVRLMKPGADEPVFTFEPDENTIYEFANTPCDVPEHAGRGHQEDTESDDEDPCMNDHFKKYYTLFANPNRPIICFKKVGAQPAPDPATCGAIGAGGIRDPFGGS